MINIVNHGNVWWTDRGRGDSTVSEAPGLCVSQTTAGLTRGELWGSGQRNTEANIIDVWGDHSILGICTRTDASLLKTERLIFMFSALTSLLFLQAIFFSLGRRWTLS